MEESFECLTNKECIPKEIIKNVFALVQVVSSLFFFSNPKQNQDLY